MRAFLSAVLVSALFATGALAADGALAPGKPAGVKQAQEQDNTLLYVAGIGLVAAGIAIAASSSNHHNTTTTTSTSTTSP
jgi:hypothetical protein